MHNLDNDYTAISSQTFNKGFSNYVIVFGIVSLILGVLALIAPLNTLRVVALFFGAILIVTGIGQLIYAFNGDDSALWRVVYAIVAALSIILGIDALISKDFSLALLATYLGIIWVVRGFSSLFLAFSLKDLGLEIFHFLIGIIGIIAGIAILESPLFASLTLTFLVTYFAIMLIITGIAEIIGGIVQRNK